MSIADHFEQARDTHFVRDVDSSSARRQFNLSMLLIVIVAVAAASLSAVVRFDTPAMFSKVSGSVVAPPSYVGKL